MSEDLDGPKEPVIPSVGSDGSVGETSPDPELGTPEDTPTRSQWVKKKWPWLVGVTAGLLVLLIAVVAIAGSAKKHPSTTTTTTAGNSGVATQTSVPTTEGLTVQLNINADWQASTASTTSATTDCSGTGIASPLVNGSTAYFSTVEGQRGTQTVTLGQGLLTDATTQLPGRTLAGGPIGGQYCFFQISVTGLAPAATYYVTVVSTSGQTTNQFSMPSDSSSSFPVAEVTVDPTTATTTTTAPPTVVLNVSGSAPSTTITIDADGTESQQNGQALPWTDSLPNVPQETVLGAQSSSGSSTASITCEIDYPGEPTVTQTSTGPYAVVTCTATSG